MTNRLTLQLCAAALALALSACAAPPPEPTPTSLPPTITSSPAPTFTPAPTATATPLGCLSEPGHVEEGEVTPSPSPQRFLIYLPPCYSQLAEQRYPVLYLLHGQTYNDDQWVRLGAATAADKLILGGEAAAFIIVFPDDRYWNLPPGGTFGERLISDIIPYIDANYRTLRAREQRALGGLSRGGGWTVRLGLSHPELFGSLGLHSPAVFKEDASNVAGWLARIPAAQMPRVWLDVGDRDKELGYARTLAGIFSRYSVVHEFHVYAGDHTEAYWGPHVEEYLRWYAQAWSAEPVP